MNQLNGTIKKITSEENISLLIVEVGKLELHTLVIDNEETASYLHEGNQVVLVCKENAVSLAKNMTGLFSIRNRIPCRIDSIQKGKVLSSVSLSGNGFRLTSVITSNAAEELNLQKGDEVEALIKTTDISLLQPEG